MTGKLILCILVLAGISCNTKTKIMDKTVDIDAFNIIGIPVKTTNENGQAMQDLGQLWSRFYGDSIIGQIPGRISDEVYSVYTDYESDYTGAYTTIIGCRVRSLADIPDGMAGKEIEGGKYVRFTCKGKMPEVVATQWKEIWSREQELKRKYTTDFEVYGPKSHNPENAEVDIYIAIR
jgi:predicted transcriptional regulator YdeE